MYSGGQLGLRGSSLPDAHSDKHDHNRAVVNNPATVRGVGRIAIAIDIVISSLAG
jgi:hypothetical protein